MFIHCMSISILPRSVNGEQSPSYGDWHTLESSSWMLAPSFVNPIKWVLSTGASSLEGSTVRSRVTACHPLVILP